MAFNILFTIESENYLAQLSAFHKKSIVTEIVQHLTHQPTTLSKSRIKQLRQPAIAEYRLRVGDFRVYYDVNSQENTVTVLRIWEKGRGLTPEGDA